VRAVLKSLLRGVCANVLAKLAVRNYRTAITCIKLYAKAVWRATHVCCACQFS
jgi:hypothetical protein